MTKYLTHDLRGLSSSSLGSIGSGLVVRQNILTGIMCWNIMAPLMIGRRQGDREEVSKDKIHSSKACLSDLFPPTRPHILTSLFSMNSAMD